MPCCTYLSQWEESYITKNKELAELLAEVNKVSSQKHVILDNQFNVHKPWWKFWKKSKTRMYHSLYVSTIAPEFQVINFYGEQADSSINHYVTADQIAAYMYGFLNGNDNAARWAECKK